VAPPLPSTPARRAILAAGVPIVLAVIALGVHSWVNRTVIYLADRNQVGYSVALSVPASDGHVRVTTSNGDVTLRTSTTTSSGIAVRGFLSSSFARPTFSHQSTAAGLNLNAQCQAPIGNCSLNFAITLAAGLPVAVADSFGNLEARALRGTVALSDNSGDLDASGLTGEIRLADAFGDLTASGLTGSIQLDNNSGDISAAGLTGDTRLQDSFGDITVTGLAAADVVARNQSGDITLTFTKIPRRVDVTDSFADITLILPPGRTAYRVDARTSFGSRIVSVPQAASAPDVITATDNSGDITIISQKVPAPPQAPGSPPPPP
jgi:hypothetical protein